MNAILREAHNERLRRLQHQVHHSQEQEAVAVVRFLSDITFIILLGSAIRGSQSYSQNDTTIETPRIVLHQTIIVSKPGMHRISYLSSHIFSIIH